MDSDLKPFDIEPEEVSETIQRAHELRAEAQRLREDAKQVCETAARSAGVPHRPA